MIIESLITNLSPMKAIISLVKPIRATIISGDQAHTSSGFNSFNGPRHHQILKLIIQSAFLTE